jgi:hypothetical protein
MIIIFTKNILLNNLCKIIDKGKKNYQFEKKVWSQPHNKIILFFQVGKLWHYSSTKKSTCNN